MWSEQSSKAEGPKLSLRPVPAIPCVVAAKMQRIAGSLHQPQVKLRVWLFTTKDLLQDELNKDLALQ